MISISFNEVDLACRMLLTIVFFTSVRERKEQRNMIKRSCVCTQFCQNTKRGYKWGIHATHPQQRPPALMRNTCPLSEQEAHSLAFGHAELRDCCHQARSAALMSTLNPATVSHQRSEFRCTFLCETGAILGFSMELRTVPAPGFVFKHEASGATYPRPVHCKTQTSVIRGQPVKKAHLPGSNPAPSIISSFFGFVLFFELKV